MRSFLKLLREFCTYLFVPQKKPNDYNGIPSLERKV